MIIEPVSRAIQGEIKRLLAGANLDHDLIARRIAIDDCRAWEQRRAWGD